MALRACGRFKLTVATLSVTSTFRHSYLAYWDTFSSVVVLFRTRIEPPSAIGAFQAAPPPTRREATSRRDPAPASAARIPDGYASSASPSQRFVHPAPQGTAAAFPPAAPSLRRSTRPWRRRSACEFQ